MKVLEFPCGHWFSPYNCHTIVLLESLMCGWNSGDAVNNARDFWILCCPLWQVQLRGVAKLITPLTFGKSLNQNWIHANVNHPHSTVFSDGPKILQHLGNSDNERLVTKLIRTRPMQWQRWKKSTLELVGLVWATLSPSDRAHKGHKSEWILASKWSTGDQHDGNPDSEWQYRLDSENFT